MTGVVTIFEILHEGKSILAGIDTPALDARILLAFVLQTDTAGILTGYNKPVNDSQYTLYKKLLERRLSGECSAYIIGKKEFWGLEFTVSPDVLVPQPDTETIVEIALSIIRPGFRILDIGTGSGALAIALKKERPDSLVYAADNSCPALEIARKNAAQLNADVTFYESDLFKNISGTFDLIVANLPYIPTDMIRTLPPEVRYEPRSALDGGEDGLSIIRRLIVEAKNHMKPYSAILLEADPGQMDALTEILQSEYYTHIKRYPDISGQNRVIRGQTSTGFLGA
ncbi:release factor glutamine methyltransferase [Spirochaetia bacterium]|nr:release factor glutamine methyltransferase [Spirochaetia bacterium]